MKICSPVSFSVIIFLPYRVLQEWWVPQERKETSVSLDQWALPEAEVPVGTSGDR